MNERERKELAGIVADCCKPCGSKLADWIAAHSTSKRKPKAQGLKARDLAALVGALKPAWARYAVFGAGYGLQVTDGEAWIKAGLSVQGEGKAVVETAPLVRWLRAQKGTVKLYVDDQGLHIDAEGVKASFGHMLEVTLPEAPTGAIRGLGSIAADKLADAVKSVAFSASDREMRYAMNGIAFDGNTLAATNGRALAAIRVWNADTDESASVPILPIGAVKALGAVLKANNNRMVSVGLIVNASAEEAGEEAPEYLTFDGVRASITVRGVEGRFPAWRGLVPKNDPTAALDVDAHQLSDALKSIMALNTEEETRAVQLSVEHKRVTVAEARNKGAQVTLDGSVNGHAGSASVLINPAYLGLAARTVNGRVALELYDEFQPIVLRVGDWRYLLMPIEKQKAGKGGY